MKKYAIGLAILFMGGTAYADSNLQALTADTTNNTGDLLYKADNSDFVSRKMTISDFQSHIMVSSLAVNAVYPAAVSANTYSNVTVPAANVAAGSLGASVMASSVAASSFQNAITAGSNVTVTNTGNGVSIAATGGGGGASALEVFSNFDGTRSSPTASIGIGDALKLSISGSTAIINVDFSSMTALGPTPTTTVIPEGSNLYYTTARSTTAISASAPLSNTNGVLSISNNLPNGSTSYIGATALYIASITTNASLNETFTGTSGATVTLSVNVSSISLPSSAATAGAYTNANITIDAHGLVTAAANGTGGGVTVYPASATITLAATSAGVLHTVATSSNVVAALVSLSTEVTARLPQGNQTFFYYPPIISPKLLSPGTTNFPTIDNSTTTGAQSLYWTAGTTQTVSWQRKLKPYAGGSIVVEFDAAGSTVVAGNASWGASIYCIGGSHSATADNVLQNYAVGVTTAGVVSGTAGKPNTLAATLSGGALNSCVEGDDAIFLITYDNVNSTIVVGDQVRLYSVAIHEN